MSDAMAVAWRWNATFVAHLPPFKATGKPVTMTGMTIYYMVGALAFLVR